MCKFFRRREKGKGRGGFQNQTLITSSLSPLPSTGL